MGIEVESVNSGGITPDDDKEIKNVNNPLPPELLHKILDCLPQVEMIRNRGICRFWRDTIDTHCTVKVKFGDHDEFLYRKLQLRIRNCEIKWIADDSDSDITFTCPQTLQKMCLHTKNEANITMCRLLHQVKRYLHTLEINYEDIQENIFYPPFTFPLIRELRMTQLINYITHINVNVAANLDLIVSLLSHHLPSLITLHIDVSPATIHMLDETYKGLFNFLAAHQQTIKRLDVNIDSREIMNVGKNLHQLQDMNQILPKSVKNILRNGILQMEYFRLYYSQRYASAWIPILQSQNNLTDLDVGDKCHAAVGHHGVLFFAISPGIQSSSATLRNIFLNNILSVGYDGYSWVPFDCTAFRNVTNLAQLTLYRETDRNAIHKPDSKEGARIINIGQIPFACLRKLTIADFVCDSGELQSIVDKAHILEELCLNNTLAPDNNPKFALTGVHGGIIHSFVQKPNKKWIQVQSINYSNQEENEKLDAVRVFYPDPYKDSPIFVHDFSNYIAESETN